VGRIGQSGGDLSLTTASETIVKEWDAIFSDHTPVRRIADDVLDIDLEEHLTSIIENHTLLHNEVWSVVSLFRQFLEAQDAEDSLSDEIAPKVGDGLTG
jgi:hypothetical protein